MSDSDNSKASHLPTDDYVASYLTKEHEYGALASRLDGGNKTVVFTALAAHGITHVVVVFDGYGDSGQIEQIDAFSGEERADIKHESVTLVRARWGSQETFTETMSLEGAIETLAYDFLERTHPGWENNDGADGEFTFDVVGQSVTLDFNAHYTASETYTHEF